MLRIKSFQIADDIDIRRFRSQYTGLLVRFTSTELFFKNENDSYLQVLSFGAVSFCGYDELKISETLDFLNNFVKNPLPEKLSEEFVLHPDSQHDKFGHNEVFLSRYSPEVLRLVMLNVSQSVVLEHYEQLASQMLDQTYHYTRMLENKGKLTIGTKSLLKFIGKTLNVKNNIIDQLYVVDRPDSTWEDEYLSRVDSGMRKTFDIQPRFRGIDYNLQIIKENLDLYRDLLHQKHSNMLEIIIIILILVEVVNVFSEKFFH